MKNKKNLLIIIFGLVSIIVSFFMGAQIKEQQYLNDKKQRCLTIITFALDKVENQDLTDQDNVEALISNVYAAYELCDDPILKQQLHDLWNYLIFEADDLKAMKDISLIELKSVSERLKILK